MIRRYLIALAIVSLGRQGLTARGDSVGAIDGQRISVRLKPAAPMAGLLLAAFLLPPSSRMFAVVALH
jgi:hypothetical protein